MSDSNFQVFARVRPPTDPSSPSNYILTGENYILLKQPYNKNIDKRESSYVFDGVFSEKLKNNEIFKKCVQPNLQDLFLGINVTFFAYGMTGSGKTHTVFGARREEEGEKGLFNLAVEDIWNKMGDNKGNITAKFSYLEIYNENVRDLLVEDQKSLNLVEDPGKGVQVTDLRQLIISNAMQIERFINIGNQKRMSACTQANQHSSRSHAILQLTLDIAGSEENLSSKLTFVDLAGSEKAQTSLDNRVLLEGSNINKSLLALGNCINSLTEKSKKGVNNFVPYRDSKLTRLLKDSLGGNTKTTMIVCLSPDLINFEETVNTLNYASRAKKIKKKVTRNYNEVNNFDSAALQNFCKTMNENLDFCRKIIAQSNYCHKCNELFSNENNNSGRRGVKGEGVNPLEKDLVKGWKELEGEFNNEIISIYLTKANKILEDKNKIMGETKKIGVQIREEEEIEQIGGKEGYLERICTDIMGNVEESYEIKQSIRELEELIEQNEKNIHEMRDKKYSAKNAKELQEGIEYLKNCNFENVEIKSKLHYALSVNRSQKKTLLDLLLKINEHSKKNILENQLSLLKKDLNNLDLLLQNNELLKEIYLKDKFIVDKESLITVLRQEISDLKTINPTVNRYFISYLIFPKTCTTLNSHSSRQELESYSEIPRFNHPNPTRKSVRSPKTDQSKKTKSDIFVKESKLMNDAKNSCDDYIDITFKKPDFFLRKTENLEVNVDTLGKNRDDENKENLLNISRFSKDDPEKIMINVSSPKERDRDSSLHVKKKRTTSSSRRYNNSPSSPSSQPLAPITNLPPFQPTLPPFLLSLTSHSMPHKLSEKKEYLKNSYEPKINLDFFANLKEESLSTKPGKMAKEVNNAYSLRNSCSPDKNPILSPRHDDTSEKRTIMEKGIHFKEEGLIKELFPKDDFSKMNPSGIKGPSSRQSTILGESLSKLGLTHTSLGKQTLFMSSLSKGIASKDSSNLGASKQGGVSYQPSIFKQGLLSSIGVGSSKEAAARPISKEEQEKEKIQVNKYLIEDGTLSMKDEIIRIDQTGSGCINLVEDSLVFGVDEKNESGHAFLLDSCNGKNPLIMNSTKKKDPFPILQSFEDFRNSKVRDSGWKNPLESEGEGEGEGMGSPIIEKYSRELYSTSGRGMGLNLGKNYANINE